MKEWGEGEREREEYPGLGRWEGRRGVQGWVDGEEGGESRAGLMGRKEESSGLSRWGGERKGGGGIW